MEVFAFQSIYFLIKSRAITIQTMMVVRITMFATNVEVILGFLSATKINNSLESYFLYSCIKQEFYPPICLTKNKKD